MWDVVTPACPAGGCLWGPTACVHPQGSSGCCAPIAPLPWEGIAANPKNKKLCPESREDRGSRFVVLRSSSLWFVSSGRVLGWETKGPRCLYSSGFFPSTFSSPLQAPGTSAQVGRFFLGECCFCTPPRLQQGVEEHPLNQHNRADPSGSLLLPLGGREEGRKEQGSLLLATAVPGSPQLRGIAAHPQMEDRALGVLAVCCFAPPNYLQAVLHCRYPPNGTESRAPPLLPPKVGADDFPPDMCVIWASLPGQLAGYFWSWSSPDLVSAGVSPCPAPCSHPWCWWGHGAPAAFVPTGLLRCPPVQGWASTSLGWLGTGGRWPGLRGLTWVYLLGKPNLRASLGGEGTGRSSWCRGRARKSKPAPRHVRPPRLAGWGVAAPFPQLLASCPGPAVENPAEGLLGGCWGPPGLDLSQCLVPLQRVLLKASFTPSACWGANGVLPTWRDSRWQMQSERAFFLVIRRLQIC